MSRSRLVIGSCNSDLARHQAGFIRDVLIREHECEAEIKIITAARDGDSNCFFDDDGILSDRALENALLEDEIDLTVHSLEELPIAVRDGLKLGAVGYRARRHDLLIIRRGHRADRGLLPVVSGSTIGVCRVRQEAQVAAHNPLLRIANVNGSIASRIGRVRNGELDAALVAAAEVDRLRLSLSDFYVVPLDPERFLPEPAQGLLGIQIREHDRRVERIVGRLGSEKTTAETALERGLQTRFKRDRALPLGVFSEITSRGYRLKAVLGVLEYDMWVGLKTIDVAGTIIGDVVSRAYAQLLESSTEEMAESVSPGCR